MLGSILLHQSPYGSLNAYQEQSDEGTAQNSITATPKSNDSSGFQVLVIKLFIFIRY
jgi:hypothetical protein